MKCDGIQGFPSILAQKTPSKLVFPFLFHHRRIRKNRLSQRYSMIILLASLLSFSALAADTEIPMPSYGVNIVIGSDCSVKVVGHVSAAKAGELARAVVGIESQCLADKAELAAAVTRSDAEAGLIAAVAIPVMNGDNVWYKSGTLEIQTGDHLDWLAFGGAAMNGNGYVPGMPVGYVDPSAAMLYRLNAGMGAHPTVPGAVMPPPADNGAALGTCQSALRGVSERLEACGKK